MDTQTKMDADTRRGVTRWLIRESMGVVFVAVILFWAAGRWDWVWGWVMVAIYAVWVAAQAILLIPRSPELLAERASRKKGEAQDDVLIMSIVGIATLAKYIVAGLDVRFGWTGGLSTTLQIVMAVVAALGYALGVWAMYVNAFFSLTYRHQEDRGQQVVTSGPYSLMRHPGYTGTVFFELASPLLLGSLWALIPGALGAVLMIVRTGREDRQLHKDLPGYAEYAKQTRYRLFPGIW
ncbi:MAG: isoprenylcysteine carboxylmethyltransferase family protein [Anaerolineales bacterium]|nr:isoprenylcysteine carboxylmethyltransferase family protein [Anaerolineales bacterium]